MDKEEAIERLNNFKTIRVLYGNTFAMHLEQLKQLQSDIETALNLIQTQQEEIDSLKDFKEIAESKVTDLNPIGLARTNQLLSRQCHKLQEESKKKDIDIIEAKEANRQLSIELQKKDKIIDLMAKELVKAHKWFYSEFDNYTKEDFIKYFEYLEEFQAIVKKAKELGLED